MEIMILDNEFASTNDLATTGKVRTLKRTLSAPGEDSRKKCRCENCRAELLQERKAEKELRKAERLAVRVERLAAKIEREAAKAERKAGKANKKEKRVPKNKIKRSKSTKAKRSKSTKAEGMDLDIALDRKEGGQTHELSHQFLQLAPKAYAPNVREMILSKGFSKIIIDGNNMLYMTSGLRQNTIHGKRKQSEKLLSLAALAFSQLVGVTTEVIFDTTQLPKRRDSIVDAAPVSVDPQSSTPTFTTDIAKIASGFPVVGVPINFIDGTFVVVYSARPEFATTDDKLISWARVNKQELSPSGLRNSDIVVVSSDRALAGELYSLGVTLIKPGNWVGLLASLLGFEDNGQSNQKEKKGALFRWFDSYCISLSSD